MSIILDNYEIDDSIQQKTEKSRGLYIHAYALDLLREKRITTTGVLLLSHVDARISPFASRWNDDPESGKRGFIPQYKLDVTDYCPPDAIVGAVPFLRQLLGVTDKTVVNTINQLKGVRPSIFKARKAGRRNGTWYWEMKTRPRGRSEPGYLFVPATIYEMYRNGHLTFREMLIVAKVASFSRNGKCCWMSNAKIGEELGLSRGSAQVTISGLVRRGILEPELVEHGNGYRKTRRYLSVVPMTERVNLPDDTGMDVTDLDMDNWEWSDSP